MRLVIIESPFAAPTDEGVQENIEYARKCVRDCLDRGEAPMASHLLYTQEGILDDRIPEERSWGIDAGLEWRRVAEATVVYTDKGITKGMEYGIKADFSLIKSKTADRYGNLIYNKTARNFGPIMCTAAETTIVQTKKIVEPGEIDPEIVVTPGIFVKRVVEVTNPADESKLVAEHRRYPWQQ